jgi:mannose-6-phosphate isomerase-like protein (cupin superfamily)
MPGMPLWPGVLALASLVSHSQSPVVDSVLALMCAGRIGRRIAGMDTTGMHTTAPAGAFMVAANEGEALPGPAGGLTTVKARTEATNGTVTALESVVASGQGPPLHVHLREDEMYYVLNGHLRFEAGTKLFDAQTGAFVFIPRRTPHCFRNVGTGSAKLLVMFTPAGMERYFDDVASLPPGSRDPDALRSMAHRSWMEILGPPLAAPGEP